MAARSKTHPIRTGREIYGSDVLIAVRRETLRGLIRECVLCTHDVQDALILPMSMSLHITATPTTPGIGYDVRNCADGSSYQVTLRDYDIHVTRGETEIGLIEGGTDSLLHLSGNTFAILLRDNIGLGCDAAWVMFTVGETVHMYKLGSKILMPLRCDYGIIQFVDVSLPMCLIYLLDTNIANPKLIWDRGIFLESDQYRIWPKGANLL